MTNRALPASRLCALVVAGPTASGKSALAVDIAGMTGGDVINADALQLYRDLTILTSRPSGSLLAQVPHALYGILDAPEVASAMSWRTLAFADMQRVADAGGVPILCGGSGLYLKALMEGLPGAPPVPADVCAYVNDWLVRQGAASLHFWLRSKDPALALRLAPNDRQRLARAVGVRLATGRPLSEWMRDPPVAAPGWQFRIVVINPAPADLRLRIDQRFLDMVDAGAIDEVRRLLHLDPPATSPIWKAIGVRELARVIQGTCDIGAAVADAQAASRAYAKRQRTWFRHQISTIWPRFDLPVPYSASQLGAVLAFVRDAG